MAEENLKISRNGILKVELFPLAVMDLSRKYMYRFVEPIPMVWQPDLNISVASNLLASFGGPKILEDELLKRYLQIIEQTTAFANWDESQHGWLKEIHAVELIECEIIPKATSGTVSGTILTNKLF